MDIILSFLAMSVDKHSITLVHVTYPPLSGLKSEASAIAIDDYEHICFGGGDPPNVETTICTIRKIL